MPELREDMLPDEEATVNKLHDKPTPEAKPETPAKALVEEPEVSQEIDDKPPKGFVPYQALDEERRKRKELELKLKDIETSSSEISDDVLSDEGRLLKQQIKALNDKISFLTETKEQEQVYGQYPQLKDKQLEFDEFRVEYPNLPLAKVAKVFLADNDMLETPRARKGLEKPTAGPKAEPDDYISIQEVDLLMKGDSRKLARMLQSGQLDPEKIR